LGRVHDSELSLPACQHVRQWPLDNKSVPIIVPPRFPRDMSQMSTRQRQPSVDGSAPASCFFGVLRSALEHLQAAARPPNMAQRARPVVGCLRCCHCMFVGDHQISLRSPLGIALEHRLGTWPWGHEPAHTCRIMVPWFCDSGCPHN
jgi:hypothetical protein